MEHSYSDDEIWNALEFARCYAESPIADSLFRCFSPSKLQQYSSLICLNFSVRRSLQYRNLYKELFPYLYPFGEARLNRLSIFLVGKDVEILNSRIFSPHLVAARLNTLLNIRVAIRN